jgi:hypothetical protein
VVSDQEAICRQVGDDAQVLRDVKQLVKVPVKQGFPTRKQEIGASSARVPGYALEDVDGHVCARDEQALFARFAKRAHGAGEVTAIGEIDVEHAWESRAPARRSVERSSDR